MKEQIKQVHDYFRDKIVNGDYEIIKIEQHTSDILIDGEYKFTIWCANGNFNFGTYCSEINTMQLILRVKDREKGYSKIRQMLKKFKKGVLFIEKRKELEKLQKELGI